MPSYPFPQDCCLPDSIKKEQLQPIHIQLPFNELIQDPTKLKFATTKLKDLEKHIQDAEERQKSPWFNGFSWYFYYLFLFPKCFFGACAVVVVLSLENGHLKPFLNVVPKNAVMMLKR